MSERDVTRLRQDDDERIIDDADAEREAKRALRASDER